MKRLFFFLTVFTSCLAVKSQDNTGKLIDESAIPTNTERYKKDYEIKDWQNPLLINMDKLKQLDLDYFDAKRKENEDVEVYDSTTGLTVIVYSIQKANESKPQ